MVDAMRSKVDARTRAKHEQILSHAHRRASALGAGHFLRPDKTRVGVGPPRV